MLRLALVSLDGLTLVAAFALAYLIRFKTGLPLLETPTHSVAFYSSVVFWAVPAWLLLFAVYRLYDRRRLFAGSQEYLRIANACTVGLVVVVLISFLDTTLIISRGWLILTWLLSLLLVGSTRFMVRRGLRVLHRRNRLLTPMVIVGANEEGQALAEQFLDSPDRSTRVIGFIDRDRLPGTRVVGDLSVLGNPRELPTLVDEAGIGEIVVATTALPRDDLLELYRIFGRDERVELHLSSGLFDVLTTGLRVEENSVVPLVTPERARITGLDAFLKTTLDYTIAASALIVLSPVMLLIGLLIKANSPGPVLHRRRVVGQSGTPFDAFKFRTMIPNAERRRQQVPINFEDRRKAFKTKEDPRVTPIGRFLRRTSLDELPQLINVLRGEMSLVGPRMIAPEEAPRYGKWQLNLVTVKPGITGPWQVQGRGDLPYEERVRLSMHYIRSYSIWRDLEILLRTVFVVVQGKGAY